MSNEKQDKEGKDRKTDKPRKELTAKDIQNRKKMLVYPLIAVIFLASMWLIFAPSGEKEEKQINGFNSELPIPKDGEIVGDKRIAYQKEAMQNKEEQKRLNLQDFSFMLSEEEKMSGNKNEKQITIPTDYQENENSKAEQKSISTIKSSANAYKQINNQLNSWYDEPTTPQVDEQAQLRIQELEKQLEESNSKKNKKEEQLELIEKSYEIAAKYMPNTQGMQSNEVGQKQTVSSNNNREKVVVQPVSQVHHNVVSLLSGEMSNDEFVEQYSKPRNVGFVTAAGKEAITDKNSIKACVYKTTTISNGKELQLRLLEPMRAGNILIPENAILTGSSKISEERLLITITSIQYANNVIPVEITVYDMDGMQGVFVPNSDEINAAKEIVANMGTSMGSSITITSDASSQLAADLGKSAIQGASQFFSKKMSEVKVTLKSGYKVLLLPKAQ